MNPSSSPIERVVARVTGRQDAAEHHVTIPVGDVMLQGTLGLPTDADGIVLFAHGSGSSRHSQRNRYVASVLREAGLATLLFDLLTEDEEAAEAATAHLRFDIPLLADRLIGASMWVFLQPGTANCRLGFFGASTGGGAALLAAATHPDLVHAVVSRGGRPDLAGAALAQVRAPTLLLVGERDGPVVQMNRAAAARLRATCSLVIIPGATHLFEEPGALDEVTVLARTWFVRHLTQTDEASGAPSGRDEPVR